MLQSVRLEEVMLTDFATLSPADTLEDALEKAVHTLQDDFPVVRGSDMVGVVSRQKILDALRAEGNGYVQSVMNRIFDVAAKQESLASAFHKLSARNLSIIPIVDEQRLVGIVTLQNLMHSMSLLAESRKLRREALDSLAKFLWQRFSVRKRTPTTRNSCCLRMPGVFVPGDPRRRFEIDLPGACAAARTR